MIRGSSGVDINRVRIREELKKNSMSSSKLSGMIGRSRTYVDQLLSGHVHEVDKATAIAIAYSLGVDVDDIIAKPCVASDSTPNQGDSSKTDKILTEILMELKQANRTLHELTEIKDDLNQIRVYESQIGARVKRIRDEICPKPTDVQGVKK